MSIHVGECREVMATLPERHYHCCVTSPPFYGLRDYGTASWDGGDPECDHAAPDDAGATTKPTNGQRAHAGRFAGPACAKCGARRIDQQIGLEATPGEFVSAMRSVFGGKNNPVGVWRVLRDDGVLFCNLGDSYAGSSMGGGPASSSTLVGTHHTERAGCRFDGRRSTPGLKPKDLMGMPWRVAFALQADGWYLRDAIVWAKPSPMPGSQRDRCTASYELIFQLTKRPTYHWDMEGIKEPSEASSLSRLSQDVESQEGSYRANAGAKTNGTMKAVGGSGRIPRNVWRIASEPSSYAFCLACRVYHHTTRGLNIHVDDDGSKRPICHCGRHDAWLSHFATFPTELPRRCIKAATSERGCCPECGAQWERVVETEFVKTQENNFAAERRGNASRDPSTRTDIRERGINSTQTLGWRPGCECGLDPVPSRVLDPFGGAGTTAIAAGQLGRDCTLIELSPDYAEMAENRIARALRPDTHRTDAAGDAPLFEGVTNAD